ncbi:MAG: sigma-70 family RNA polymerase sigma factor [Kiloniellales bacterium]|nr:sigma-70 family RNA polymerase sigma factor [Kiloniellales bacterium]
MAEQSSADQVSWVAFQARLRAYLRRRVDPAAVDDLVGDILLRLVRHREALEAARDPVAWMLRLAANAVTDHHRRRDVEKRALSRARIEFVTEAAAEAADEGATEEIGHCLRPLVEALPARYREALLLTEIEGLTRAEAALRLGLSPSGMKSRVQRGRAKLKQALLRCCEIRTDRRGGVLDYRRRRADVGLTGCRPC